MATKITIIVACVVLNNFATERGECGMDEIENIFDDLVISKSCR